MSGCNTLRRFQPAAISRAPSRAVPDRSIRRGQQKQEQCPVSLVFGSGSAAFRTLHDDRPFGCADAPPPCSAALPEGQFKNWKLIQAQRSCLAKRFQRTPPVEKSLTQLVGGNAKLVGRKVIVFSCSEAGNFHRPLGSQIFSGRAERVSSCDPGDSPLVQRWFWTGYNLKTGGFSYIYTESTIQGLKYPR